MYERQRGAPASRWLTRLENAGIVLGAILLWVIVALICFQISLRELFLMGLPWVDELSRYLHIIIVSAGLAYILRLGANVDIRLLIDLFPSSVQRVFAVMTALVVLGSSLFIVWGSWQLINRAGASRLPASGLEVKYFLLPVFVGFTLLALEAVRQVFISLSRPRQQGSDGKNEGEAQ